jgi:hypothetical protein
MFFNLLISKIRVDFKSIFPRMEVSVRSGDADGVICPSFRSCCSSDPAELMPDRSSEPLPTLGQQPWSRKRDDSAWKSIYDCIVHS